MKTNILLVLGVLVYGCSPKIATSTTKVAVSETSSFLVTPDLAEGQNLYENNCASCHKLYDRKDFSKTEWLPITMKMQKKAKIDDATREKIYNYLTM